MLPILIDHNLKQKIACLWVDAKDWQPCFILHVLTSTTSTVGQPPITSFFLSRHDFNQKNLYNFILRFELLWIIIIINMNNNDHYWPVTWSKYIFCNFSMKIKSWQKASFGYNFFFSFFYHLPIYSLHLNYVQVLSPNVKIFHLRKINGKTLCLYTKYA